MRNDSKKTISTKVHKMLIKELIIMHCNNDQNHSVWLAMALYDVK